MSVNKIILVGRLGKDPEKHVTDTDLSITKFSMATDRYGKDKGTDWHNIVVFGKQADAAERYLSKGRQVYVEGRVQYRRYEKDGETKYFTEVVASDIQFLSSPDDGASSSSRSGGGGRKPLDSEKEITPSLSDEEIPF